MEEDEEKLSYESLDEFYSIKVMKFEILEQRIERNRIRLSSKANDWKFDS